MGDVVSIVFTAAFVIIVTIGFVLLASVWPRD